MRCTRPKRKAQKQVGWRDKFIARAIWLYCCFGVSLRDVEEMLLERGIIVSYETIRRWCRRHGPEVGRREVPTKDDVWHLDELVLRVNGGKRWLWRAVDQDGYVLQTRRNTKAARTLLTRLPKKQGLTPKRIVTDNLRSYAAARRQIMLHVIPPTPSQTSASSIKAHRLAAMAA